MSAEDDAANRLQNRRSDVARMAASSRRANSNARRNRLFLVPERSGNSRQIRVLAARQMHNSGHGCMKRARARSTLAFRGRFRSLEERQLGIRDSGRDLSGSSSEDARQ